MKREEQFSLIEGSFLPNDANEILMNIFSTKINFHEMKNFTSMEHSGKPDAIAQKRIPELKGSIEQLSKLIAEARANNLKLTISSKINISVSE